MDEDTKKEEEKKDEPKSEPFDAAQGKLEECKQKCEEYLNNWKRERADFLNYKKDEMERMAFLGKYAKEDMILKILPILDNIYLAEKQIPENLKSDMWVEGFLQIQKQAEELLKKERVEAIETVGQKFDPNTMESIASQSQTNADFTQTNADTINKQEKDMVVEELQKGYKMEGKVLRPAKVKVTK